MFLDLSSLGAKFITLNVVDRAALEKLHGGQLMVVLTTARARRCRGGALTASCRTFATWAASGQSSLDVPTYLMSRFLPPNIMHNLHDDLIPLYHTMAQAAAHAVPQRTPGPDLHSQYEVRGCV